MTPDPKRSSTALRAAPGFLIALALGLVIAFGGLVWLDGGSAQASEAGALVSAADLPDAEACTSSGYSSGVSFSGYAIYGDTTMPGLTYPTTVINGVTYISSPYYQSFVFPQIFPVGPATENQPYLSPAQVSYACNVSSNCQPVAYSDAAICPGNPAAVSLNSSLTSATCGSATNVDARVVGKSGLVVGDGTPVLFATNLGMIPAESSTTDGVATASLVFPPKTTGTATLTVTAGTAKAEAKITVTC